MSGGIENAGEAATGRPPDRAFDGRAADPDEARRQFCLNCGAPLLGPYCHRCGQKGRVHRRLKDIGHDIAHGVLHLDGKIWRTLPLLAWRPGELTRRYIEGERAKFVSPLALFLFSVFLMFALFTAIGGFSGTAAVPDEEQARALQELREGRSEIEEEARRKTNPNANDAQPRIDIGETGWPAFDRAIEKAESNPSLLFYKVQANAYKFSWALIPISVPFVLLLFLHRRRHRRFKIYDHTIFVTYSITAMMLLFAVVSLIGPLGLGEGFVLAAIAFIPPIHIYRQLRGAYELGRFSALWRTFLLLVFAVLASTLFFLLLLTIGLLA